MRRRVHPLALLALSACLLASACGTQVDDSVRQQAASAALSGGGGGGTAVGAEQGTVGEDGTVVPGTDAAAGGDAAAAPGTDPAAGGTGAAPVAGSGTKAGSTTKGGTAKAGAKPGTGPARRPPPAGAQRRRARPHRPAATAAPPTSASRPTRSRIGTWPTCPARSPACSRPSVNGTNAYIAYVNSQGGLFGRKLKIAVADSQTSCEGDRNGHAGPHGQGVRLRRLVLAVRLLRRDRAGQERRQSRTSTSRSRPRPTRCRTTSASTRSATTLEQRHLRLGRRRSSARTSSSTRRFMYVNLPAVNNVAKLQKKAAESAGWKFDYERAVGATETDFTADIIQMNRQRHQDVPDAVQRRPDGQLQAAGRPPVASSRRSWRRSMYDQTFFKKLGGAAAAEGMYGSNGSALFFSPEDAAAIPSVATVPEVLRAGLRRRRGRQLRRQRLGLDRAARARAIRKAGPKLTRAKVLQKLKATKKFDAEGFYAPANPGDKKAGNCYVIWQIKGGKYVRTDSPAKGFRCDGKQR